MKKGSLSLSIVKRLFLLSFFIITIALLIIFYMTQNIKSDVYNKSKNELQNQVIGRVNQNFLFVQQMHYLSHLIRL